MVAIRKRIHKTATIMILPWLPFFLFAGEFVPLEQFVLNF